MGGGRWGQPQGLGAAGKGWVGGRWVVWKRLFCGPAGPAWRPPLTSRPLPTPAPLADLEVLQEHQEADGGRWSRLRPSSASTIGCARCGLHSGPIREGHRCALGAGRGRRGKCRVTASGRNPPSSEDASARTARPKRRAQMIQHGRREHLLPPAAAPHSDGACPGRRLAPAKANAARSGGGVGVGAAKQGKGEAPGSVACGVGYGRASSYHHGMNAAICIRARAACATVVRD